MDNFRAVACYCGGVGIIVFCDIGWTELHLYLFVTRCQNEWAAQATVFFKVFQV